MGSNASRLNRRTFHGTAIGLAGLAAFSRWLPAADVPKEQPYRILKTLKLSMVKEGGTIRDKFAIAKKAGFVGVEFESPGPNTQEVIAAIDETGLPVDGTICATHWQVRHTDPDPAVRAKALEDLKAAIRQTHEVGGHTCLLVVGHGKDGMQDELVDRAYENIWQAVPLAAELGIVIAFENVWNHFMYDHEGGGDQTAERFVEFVDRFDSPWVGMQFDIGNHWKYGNPGEWIRTLGKRVVKLDIKGFSRATDKFVPIGEGDIPWADVREALSDIRFHGWCAAEVDAGGLEHLTQVAQQMDRVLGLAS